MKKTEKKKNKINENLLKLKLFSHEKTLLEKKHCYIKKTFFSNTTPNLPRVNEWILHQGSPE